MRRSQALLEERTTTDPKVFGTREGRKTVERKVKEPKITRGRLVSQLTELLAQNDKKEQ